MAANTIDITDALSRTNFSPISRYSTQSLVSTTLNLTLIAGTLASFFFLLWGAIQWISSGGDKDGLEKAKKKITTALVGLTVLFSLFATGFLINNIFNVNIFNLCLPSLVGSTCTSSSGGSSGSQIVCSSTCKSNSDGSTRFCYPQDIGGGTTQQVSCGPGGFTCNPSPCWSP